MEVQEKFSLKSYNTFGLDVKAEFFVEVTTLDQLRESLSWAKAKDLSMTILGGGSNVLLTKDVAGLVIHISCKGTKRLVEKDASTVVEVMAGEIWHEFVLWAINENLAGVENLSLIPGTVGAAPMQNIGAYGVEIKDVFVSLDALDRASGELVTFTAEDCQFGYRESVFKRDLKDQYVIWAVRFELRHEPIFHTSYGAIQNTLQQMGVEKLTIKAVSDAVIAIRQSKLPDPAEIGNSGSFFKNPEIPLTQFESLKKEFPNIIGYPLDDHRVKVPAGWLIDQAGWKGYREGEIGVHAKQALVLVNYGNGEGDAIWELALRVQQSVKERYGIEILPEVNIL